MHTHKGFALVTVLIVIAGLLVVGSVYVATNPQVLEPMLESSGENHSETELDNHSHESDEAHTHGEASIVWKFTNHTPDAYGMSRTTVDVIIDGTVYGTGTFEGSCKQVDAAGGIDGAGLLAGEISAVQCWYAGAGDEIGVFAHEDGGYQIMVGEIGEPDGEGSTGFRGNFEIRADILP